MFPTRVDNYGNEEEGILHPIGSHEIIGGTVIKVIRRNSDSEGERVDISLNHLHFSRLEILDVQIVELFSSCINGIRKKPVVSTDDHIVHCHRTRMRECGQCYPSANSELRFRTVSSLSVPTAFR